MLREIKKLREGETGIDRKKRDCVKETQEEEKEWMDGGGKKSQSMSSKFLLPQTSLSLKVYTCKLLTLEKPGLMEKRGREGEKRGAHFLSQTHQEIHVNKLDNSEH